MPFNYPCDGIPCDNPGTHVVIFEGWSGEPIPDACPDMMATYYFCDDCYDAGRPPSEDGYDYSESE